jgi:hypothetical protein
MTIRKTDASAPVCCTSRNRFFYPKILGSTETSIKLSRAKHSDPQMRRNPRLFLVKDKTGAIDVALNGRRIK